MSEKCQGCGAVLQHDQPGAAGYTPKVGSKLCQRCFRLTHYDEKLAERLCVRPTSETLFCDHVKVLYLLGIAL